MFRHFILGAVALLAGASATVLALLILGVRRGDRGKRLTGQPRGRSEMLSRRVLTGSRGCDSRDNAEEGQCAALPTLPLSLIPAVTATTSTAGNATPGPAGCGARHGEPARTRTAVTTAGRGDAR